MSTALIRRMELALLFVVLPIYLALPLPLVPKVLITLLAVFHVFHLMFKNGLLTKVSLFSAPEHFEYKPLVIRLLLFVLISTFIVWWYLPEKLFYVITQNPLLWFGISVFYSVMSVLPQELIYRHFFYWRYAAYISPKIYFVVNAILFSSAHLMFMNSLVLALTLAGGLLFVQTYNKSRSVMVTSIEHAIYGLWLYTVGLGDMLAFPGPNLS